MVKRHWKDRDTARLIVDATITGSNQFTEPVELAEGPANLSVGGSGWSATVTLQRSFDGGIVWRDVWSTTEPTEQIVDVVEARVLWRLGCRAGNHSSGSIPVRLSQ